MKITLSLILSLLMSFSVSLSNEVSPEETEEKNILKVLVEDYQNTVMQLYFLSGGEEADSLALELRELTGDQTGNRSSYDASVDLAGVSAGGAVGVAYYLGTLNLLQRSAGNPIGMKGKLSVLLSGGALSSSVYSSVARPLNDLVDKKFDKYRINQDRADIYANLTADQVALWLDLNEKETDVVKKRILEKLALLTTKESSKGFKMSTILSELLKEGKLEKKDLAKKIEKFEVMESLVAKMQKGEIFSQEVNTQSDREKIEEILSMHKSYIETILNTRLSDNDKLIAVQLVRRANVLKEQIEDFSASLDEEE